MATIAVRARASPFCVGAIIALTFTGCGVPSSMGVRTGTEPSFQDDDVRFRTTYFFRVFDYCQRSGRAIDDPGGIRIDSLYRFRMTGKASSLFNDIVFESGTLKAQEIDPFGAKVAYDKANRSFYFQSRAQTERAAACAARDAELDRLQRDYNAFSGDDEQAKKIKGAIATEIAKLHTDSSCAATTAAAQAAGASHVAACAPGEQLRRGFQVLGPEGFRTFDQDDRLLMAMSSKASPLIAQLKDISGRVLAEQTTPGDALLALVRARLKVSQTLCTLDTAYGPEGGAIKSDDIADVPAGRPEQVNDLSKKFKPAVAP